MSEATQMNWPEAATSIAGMASIVVIMYIGVIDGLTPPSVIAAVLSVAGLGGYKIAADYFAEKGP